MINVLFENVVMLLYAYASSNQSIPGGHWCGRKPEYPERTHVLKRGTAIPCHIQLTTVNHGDRTRVTASAVSTPVIGQINLIT